MIGAATIGRGGTLAPGSSIESLHTGALSFTDGSTLAIELDSAAGNADLVVVSGGLSLDGVVTLTLTDIAASPTPFALNTTFSLLNYSGAWNGGVFTYGTTQLGNGSVFSSGANLWQIAYNSPSGGQNFVAENQPGSSSVNITSVPEPSTYALLIMSAAGALWWARRRDRSVRECRSKYLPMLAAFSVCPLLGPSAAEAQLLTVPGVYGTGLDNTGALLPEGSPDPHYTIVSGPATGSTFVVDSSSMDGAWIPNGPTSSWISHTATSVSTKTGAYIYRTTFDLTGFIPETAVLIGFWNTDNNGTEILLNGTSFPFTTSAISYNEAPTPFSITTGFLPGLNTLDFAFYDDGFYTGLRVSGLQAQAAVPEPSTYALLVMTAASGLWWVRRRW
jgi:hypothetical protein